MAEFFRTSTVWVVDYRFRGSARRWFKTYREGVDAAPRVEAELRALHGNDARLLEVRRASEEEEDQYLRGELPVNMMCPTGR